MLKKIGYLTIRLLEALGVSLLFGLCILVYRLNQEPIPLDFLKKYLVANFSFEERHITAEVGSIVLTLQKEINPIGVRVKDFKLKDGNGVVVLNVPETSLNFSWIAFFKGELLPKEMKLYKPAVRIPTSLFKGGQIQTDTPVLDTGFSYLRLILQEEYFGRFEQVSLKDADIRLIGNDGKRAIHWPDLNVDILRSKNIISFKTTFHMRQGRDRKKFALEADYDARNHKLILAGDFDPFRPSTFKDVAPFLTNFTANVGGRVVTEATLPRTFTLKELPALLQHSEMDLSLSDGFIPLLYNDRQLFYINKMRLESHYDPATDLFKMREFSLHTGQMFIRATGQVDHASDLFYPSETKRSKGFLHITGDRVSLQQMMAVWPKMLGEDPREWIEENFKQALFRNLNFKFDLAASPTLATVLPSKLDGRVDVENATLTYLEGMPAVENGFGTAHLTLNSIDIHLDQGNTYNIHLIPGSKVTLFELDKDSRQISVDIDGEGPVQDVMQLINSPRLRLADDFDIQPESTSGMALVDFFINVPLKEEATEEDATIRIKASATDVGVKGLFGSPYTLSQGTLSLTLNEAGLLTINGKGLLEDSIPLTLLLTQTMRSTPRKTHAKVFMFLNPEDLVLFHLDMPEIKSTMSLLAEFDLNHDTGKGTLTAVSDLTETEMDLAFPMYRKKAGVPLDLMISFDFDLASSYKKGFGVLSSGDEKIFDGTFLITKDGLIDHLRFTHLYPDAKLNVFQDPETKGLNFIVSGSLFKMDLFPFLDYLSSLPVFGGTSSTSFPTLDIFAAFDKLYLSRNDASFDQVSVSMLFENNELLDGDILFKMDETPVHVPFKWQEEDQTIAFSGDIPNIGAFFRRLDVLPFVRSGRMKFSGRKQPDGLVKGAVSADKIVMKDPPMVVSLLSKASLTSLVKSVGGNDVEFEAGSLFTFKDSILSVQKSYLRGAGFGLLQTGTANFKTRRLNIRGTLVPAYGINSFLGRIPLLGLFFSGGEDGGGFLAFTFRAKGTFEKPNITVNPFSFFAPGIFRGLFMGDDPLEETPEPGVVPTDSVLLDTEDAIEVAEE